MVKAIMHGCNGKMGQVITKLIDTDPEIEIVAGIDPHNDICNSYPVYRSVFECGIEADVIIDFAAACAIDNLLDYAVKKGIPVVLCTTGLSPEQVGKVEDATEHIAVLKSANMSLGINTLFKVLRNVAPLLAAAGFDIEIVEKHHRMKVDAPSGTALALADCINKSVDNKYEYKFDRSRTREKRADNEIGISAVRGGSIVGEHEVIFAGEDEVIEFKHTAYSKAVFAKGAIEAAKYLAGKPAGGYTMREVIG